MPAAMRMHGAFGRPCPGRCGKRHAAGRAGRLLALKPKGAGSMAVDELEPCDVVVVGGGAHGASAADALGKAGKRRRRRVVLVETSAKPSHGRSSSGGASRIFRLTDAKAHYAAMAREALPLWRDLEARTGATLLRTTGCLDVLHEASGSLQEAVAASESAGVRVEPLAAAEVLERTHGAMRLPDGYGGVFERSGGITSPEDTLAAYYRALRRNLPAEGGAVLAGHSVVEVEDDGTRFALLLRRHNPEVGEAPFARLLCDQVVFATAAAAPVAMAHFFGWRALRNAAAIQKMTYGFWGVRDAGRAAMNAHVPVWRLIPSDADAARPVADGGIVRAYGFPCHEARGFAKVAPHHVHTRVPWPEDDSDLLWLAREARPPEEEQLRELHESVVRHVFPHLVFRGEAIDGSTPAAWPSAASCLYTVLDDEEFVLDYVPTLERGRAVVAVCCNGAGFKHTPLIGTAVRDLVDMRADGPGIGAGGAVPVATFRADRAALTHRAPAV